MNGNEFNQDEQHNAGAPDGADENTMPIGIDGMDENEEFGAADGFNDMTGQGKRTLNGGALLLVIVVIIAVAGLFSMRTLTRASAADEAPTEVEQSIESFLSLLQSSKEGDETENKFQIGADEATVLDILNESYASRQVALTDVQRNPFIIFEESAPKETSGKPRGPDPTEQKRQDRRVLFEQAAGRLELRSVLMGAAPMATINQNIVQVGQSVMAEPENISFRVLEISNDGVVILAEDKELGVKYQTTLTIDREQKRRGSPQRSRRRGPVRPR